MLTAIIDGLHLIRQIIDGLKTVFAFIEANKEEKWFQESAKTFTQLRNTINATGLSDADRTKRLKDAGRNIRDLLSGM